MSERKRAEYGTGEDMERKADTESDRPEYWSLVCPMGGEHIVHAVIWEWPVYFPSHKVLVGRACIKCGLFDRFIEESE